MLHFIKTLNKLFKMEANGLPVYSGAVDHLRYGFRSLENEFSAQHPIQNLQKSANSSAWASKLDMVRRTHGSHMAMRLATEKETFSRIRRLPGLESSNIALQTLMGNAESVDFPDFLNGTIIRFCIVDVTGNIYFNYDIYIYTDVVSRPEAPRLELHSQMEVKFGIL